MHMKINLLAVLFLTIVLCPQLALSQSSTQDGLIQLDGRSYSKDQIIWDFTNVYAMNKVGIDISIMRLNQFIFS